MRTLSTNIPSARLGGLAVAFAILGALLTVAGCASKKPSSVLPAAREDVTELRQVTSDSLKAVRASLQSLDQAGAQIPCSAELLAAFTKDVQRLEVDSFKMRTRAQAMRARGPDYFEEWHQHLAALEDPEAREMAVQRHDLLQQSFNKIRENAQQTREAFQPFMSGLHHLRNGLENNPAAAGAQPTKDLIKTTREKGQQVEQGLITIQEELKTVATMLKRAKLKE